MAKHKKTRREKKVADKRHTLYHLESNTAQEEIKASEKVQITSFETNTHTNTITANLDYVKNDIRKILIVSSVIFITQIVLYFILNKV